MRGASPRLGSSGSYSLGLAISARPSASIWRSPPDSVPAGCRARSFSRGFEWAAEHDTQYQRMIRRLLDAYVDAHAGGPVRRAAPRRVRGARTA
jgi:hypothetical protein